ncbi:hypothetical protein MBLNU457_g2792t1 [Dothideomycetes sp. NU457]
MAPPGPYSYTRETRKQVQPRYKPDDNRQHTKHPYFGQASALPPADTTIDGEEDEATAYLRAVRAEAEGLASVVTANPQEPPYNDDYDYDPEYDYNDDYSREENDDPAGWYEDGAYIGAPATASPPTTTPTAQTLYHNALCTRFLTLRTHLHLDPSVDEKASLPPERPTTVSSRHNELAHREWRYHLRSTDPVPFQLRAMDTRTVLQLLSMIDGQLEASVNEGRNIPAVTSRWVWGLLGRLASAGQLSTQQVGTVRDLAKTAVWVGFKYRKRGVENGEGSELEVAKKRMLGRLQEEGEMVPDDNTLATLDLIVTVAGEFYGQRDLLQSRLTWERTE